MIQSVLNHLLATALLLAAPAALCGIDDPLNSPSSIGEILNAPAIHDPAATSQPPTRVTASIAGHAPTRTATTRADAVMPQDPAAPVRQPADTSTASR